MLETLWSGAATIAEIARSTSLSRTAAESVLADLMTRGWAVDGGPPAQRSLAPGRPASVFHFSPEAGHIAGIDIGAHHVSACVAGLTGEKISTVRVIADESMPAAQRLALASRALEQALTESGRSTDDLWAVTVGSPGVIDKGKVIHFGGAGMPGWIGLDIAEHFADATAGIVLVEGDSALGALAESAYGAGRGVPDLVYILSGIRTGAAVIVNGQTLRGHRGAAGLVGELPELRWRDIEHQIYARSRSADEAATRGEIFDRARTGDAGARAIVQDFADALAVGASAMVLALDPEVLVIGGPNTENADLFLERFTAEIAKRCPILPDVRISTLGPDAVLTGSVRLGIEAISRALHEAVETQPAFPAPSNRIAAGSRAT
ncbi:ROK family protein [Glaciibacter psychrotolerans]|uniref:Putative NBD/HSP70 family sugar kinase n=1 Tax=Glaciibacter psychrotolerans TaxID=670054 RepID=A0A7Z0EG91_9MICO|nr:putative NBD/HSP70 family sugar kinase [Leifsonia psychrotolerans]